LQLVEHRNAVPALIGSPHGSQQGVMAHLTTANHRQPTESHTKTQTNKSALDTEKDAQKPRPSHPSLCSVDTQPRNHNSAISLQQRLCTVCHITYNRQVPSCPIQDPAHCTRHDNTPISLMLLSALTDMCFLAPATTILS